MPKKRFVLISFVLLCLWMPRAVAVEDDQAEASDYLEMDLARQIYLVEQTQKLTALIVELAKVPEEVIDILLASEKLNADSERIKAALVALQTIENTAEEQGSESDGRKTQPAGTPKLTTDNILFVEVAQQGILGAVMFEYEGKTYRAHPGESFKIRGKEYTVVGIKYVSAHQIEVSVKTKAGITHLQYTQFDGS